MPVGKQLATVGSMSTRPLVTLACPGSVVLLAFHFASAHGWKDGSSLGLKVGAESVMLAHTPVKSGLCASVAAPVFFAAAGCAEDCAKIAGERASAVRMARMAIWRWTRMEDTPLVCDRCRRGAASDVSRQFFNSVPPDSS